MPSPGLDSLGSPKPDSVYYDRMSFGSAVSRGGQMPGGGGGGNTAQLEREKEELKRDYEYQIATLTAKLTGLLSSHSEHAESISRETEKREEAEEEISRLRKDLDVVRRELDEVKGELRREREMVEDAERQRMERELEFQRELESAREETKRERSQVRAQNIQRRLQASLTRA
jgi:chromosome segregation ATPase